MTTEFDGPIYIERLTRKARNINNNFLEKVNPTDGTMLEGVTQYDMNLVLSDALQIIINIGIDEFRNAETLEGEARDTYFQGTDYESDVHVIISALNDYDSFHPFSWTQDRLLLDRLYTHIQQLLAIDQDGTTEYHLIRIRDTILRQSSSIVVSRHDTALESTPVSDPVTTTTSQEQASLLSQLDETTRRLLTDIDRAEEVLTTRDLILYDRISYEIDLNKEKDDALISDLQDLLRTDKDSFKRLDNYVYAYLKYEEHLGDSPDLIDNYRYFQRLFDAAFKRHEREEQARQSEILVGGRKQKRKYRSKKRKSNKQKGKYRSKRRKF